MSHSRASRFFVSQLMAWVVGLIACGYFLFSINTKVWSDPAFQNYTFWEKVAKSIKMPNVNLGIDLSGGARLVVSVDQNKAIEGRLDSETRSIDHLFKKENIKHPLKKERRGLEHVFIFENEDAASVAYSLVKNETKGSLVVSRKGTELVVSLPADEIDRIKVKSVEQAVDILKRRLDVGGVQGVMVRQHGGNQIEVQLPGDADVDEKKELISKTAHLEFKIVEEVAASREALLEKFDGDLPSDKVIVPGREEGSVKFYLVSRFADVTGDHITFAKEDIDTTGRHAGKVAVHFKLDSTGARDFAELTTNNVGRSLGIVIDDEMYSSANITEPITGGECQITGQFSMERAHALAVVLTSGAVQGKINFEYETKVSATLGQDCINKGLISCLIGLILLVIFSIWYYRLAGLFAILALIVNLFLIMLFLSWFHFALTLPGIAGMVLTLGMAIDASILIYEKTREELAVGTPFRKSIMDGFSGSMAVILDSNITTFLTGLVLYKYGGPTIQGFAVTLMAGIIATIIAGIYFLKALYLFVLDNTNIKKFGLEK